jgi:hypothetical protein
VAALLGGFLVVLGVIALARSGLDSWTAPTELVWGFGHTPLMAVIEILLGLGMLAAVSNPFTAKTTLAGLGALMAVFGAIVLLEPAVFDDLLGANRRMGLLYAGSGAGGVLLSTLIPVVR